jgi:hypothetical protein
MASSQSTYTLQNVYDDLIARGDMDPGWDVAGFTVRPIISIANKVALDIVGGEGMFPWKWNQYNLPQFCWNSWQQDYALIGQPGATAEDGDPSVTNLFWLQEGMAIDINNPSMPKPFSIVECGRNTGRATGAYISNNAFVQPICRVIALQNVNMYFGTWGAAITGNPKWGNNPQPNQQIFNPIGAANAVMPNNPILQIQDSNGNFLVVTTYGTTGSTAPAAAPNAAPGTVVDDGSVHWTVVDPFGYGLRLTPVPSQTGTVWQMNVIGQLNPPKFTASTSLGNQTLAPLIDSLYPTFLDGAAIECYRYSSDPKVRAKYNEAIGTWLRAITNLRRGSDREKEQHTIKPARTILGAGGSENAGNLGPFWPYGYPVR